MSDAAESLLRLTARIDEAANALMGARFGEFAEAAAALETKDLVWAGRGGALRSDPAAEAACHALQSSLARPGGLLGHVAGVHQALQALDPARTAIYDRHGADASSGGRIVREEA